MFHQMGGGSDMSDIMAAMMGGGGMRSAPRKRKGRDVGVALPVTLEDLYNGKIVDLPREKTILCSTCNGRGTKNPNTNATCSSCNGKGAKIMSRQMGPMIQQMQVPCDICRGSGVKIDPNDMCTTCSGKRTKEVKNVLKVKIEKGMSHQSQIPFPGEGDVSPDIEIPGAIVAVLHQTKHDIFVRDGSDLQIKQEIPLADALCGFQFVIEHLDKRKLVVRSERGQMIKPGDKKVIIGEGMPIRGSHGSFGDLIIEFNVKFPERLQTGAVEALAAVLPHAPAVKDYDEENAEIVYVDRHPLDEIRKELDKEDDDDEEGASGGGVQCAQA
eukprot:Tbor_TRINITY_DN6059_c0_g1::TRINITY_DN6059_c0_g1_i11::g.11664::m.11664/K09503/DNAJA2; DnaJ homolog subfamily A member 2